MAAKTARTTYLNHRIPQKMQKLKQNTKKTAKKAFDKTNTRKEPQYILCFRW